MHRLAVISLLLSSCLPAQAIEASQRPCGVTLHEGVIHGLGPDYSARFEPHGVTFTPALGDRAAVPQPLRFTLTEVGRGTEPTWRRQNDVAPSVDGDSVRYRHSNDLAEVYDVRADGIEQSFLFGTRPAGRGDLVVRGAITTELSLVHVGDDGARFERACAGGVSFGAVTGIDANGVRCRGSLRCSGDALELVLPAAFVDTAAYPLVLDPLIGSAFTVGNAPGGVDLQPAVAFDAGTGRYLVVWNVNLSTTVAEVRGQLVTAGGTVLGSQLLLSSLGLPTEAPAVANIDASGRFLVTWVIRTSTPIPTGTVPFDALQAAAVSAANGAVSTTLNLAGGAFLAEPSQAVVGGDLRANGPATALVVHRSRGVNTNSILARQVLVPSTGAPVLLGTTTVATSSNRIGDPAVSPHLGTNGGWLVTFGQSVVSLTAPLTRLFGQRIDAGGALCGAPVTLRNAGAGADLRRPTIATPDGQTFAVAWEDAITQSIELRMLVWTGSCASGSWSLGTVQNPTLYSGAASAPSLAFAKDKYVLAWAQDVGSITKVYCKGLDPANCAACGAELRTDTTTISDTAPAVAARWDAGDTGSDEALVVWSNGTIRGRRFEARGSGSIESLGGGCSVGGFSDFNTYSGQPILGDDTFGLQLLAPSAPIVALVIGFSTIDLPCGSCTLVPSLDVVLPGVSPTPVPIPCDPGLLRAELHAQWLLLKPSDCPLTPMFATSNTLKFTIGE